MCIIPVQGTSARTFIRVCIHERYGLYIVQLQLLLSSSNLLKASPGLNVRLGSPLREPPGREGRPRTR